MDPNETLRRIRRLIKEIRAGDDTYNDQIELMEAFEALDEWISRGGFLPSEWQDATIVSSK